MYNCGGSLRHAVLEHAAATQTVAVTLTLAPRYEKKFAADEKNLGNTKEVARLETPFEAKRYGYDLRC